jgi:hypothetical protein
MSTIEVIALKPFLYSENGYTEISISEKQVFDLPERFFQGLNDARFVRRATIGDGHISLNSTSVIDANLGNVTAGVTTETGRKSTKSDRAEDTVEMSVAAKMVDDAVKQTAESFLDKEMMKINSDVEIPDDWQSLKFFALRSLAAKFGETPKNMEEAVAAIEAELAKRNQE